MIERSNYHATVIVAGDRGVMITGPSGSGKTTLALALIAHCQATGLFARLISDDQAFLAAEGRRLVATVPETIAAMIEVHGRGPVTIAHEPRAVIDLLVELVPPDRVPRIDEGATETFAGISLPCVKLAARNVEASVASIASMLAIGQFRKGSVAG